MDVAAATSWITANRPSTPPLAASASVEANPITGTQSCASFLTAAIPSPPQPSAKMLTPPPARSHDRPSQRSSPTIFAEPGSKPPRAGVWRLQPEPARKVFLQVCPGLPLHPRQVNFRAVTLPEPEGTTSVRQCNRLFPFSHSCTFSFDSLNAQQPAKPVIKAAARLRPAASSQLRPSPRCRSAKTASVSSSTPGRADQQSVRHHRLHDRPVAQRRNLPVPHRASTSTAAACVGAGHNSMHAARAATSRRLPLALGEDPTAVDFYNAIRVSPRRSPQRCGVHHRPTPQHRDHHLLPDTDKQPFAEKRSITVIGEAGEIRTLDLTPATEVRLLDTDLPHQSVLHFSS